MASQWLPLRDPIDITLPQAHYKILNSFTSQCHFIILIISCLCPVSLGPVASNGGSTRKRWGCLLFVTVMGEGATTSIQYLRAKDDKSLAAFGEVSYKEESSSAKWRLVPNSQERKTLSYCSCPLTGLGTSRLSPPATHSMHHKRCKTANLVFCKNLLIIPNSCSQIFNVSSLHIRSEKSTLDIQQPLQHYITELSNHTGFTLFHHLKLQQI